jgi:two-component sensor histidine kinase
MCQNELFTDNWIKLSMIFITKKHFWVFFSLFLLYVNIHADAIDMPTQEKISLLEQSSIYLDENNLKVEEIIKKNLFRPYDKAYLNIGMRSQTIWITFDLRNGANRSLVKTLVLSSPLLEDIALYKMGTTKMPLLNGRMHSSDDHETLFYRYRLEIEPKTSVSYYLKVRSDYTPVSFGLTLQNEKSYVDADRHQQLIAVMLLSVIMALALYNFLISLRTKDKGYFYYSIYLLALIWHQMSYLGLTQIYFSSGFNAFDISIPNLKGSLIIFFSALFAIDFLKIRELPRLYGIYKIFIFVTAVNLAISCLFGIKALQGITIISILYVLFTLASGIISYRYGNKQARLFILGFLLLFASYVAIALDALGVTSIMQTDRSLLVWSTAIDALILSLAFADRYMILQEEKTKTDQRILDESKNRERIIQAEVTQKTAQLEEALEGKEILLSEVHHRVRNNLQIILSMVRLQSDHAKAGDTKDKFTSLESRISAIAQTYDALIGEDNLEQIDMDEYIETLLYDIEKAHSDMYQNIKITKEIKATVPLKESVYVGLIINELVNNAYKHAFDGGDGIISVTLAQEKSNYVLIVTDSGNGFVLSRSDHTLGLKLIDALVLGQLKGTIERETKDGTKYTIRFKA